MTDLSNKNKEVGKVISEDKVSSIIAPSGGIPVSQTNLTFKTDVVSHLHEISRQLGILIQYQAILHKINLDEED